MSNLVVRGGTAIERVLWMALWTPGPNGRRGLPYVLVGDPGTVKTAKCRQLAKEGGLHFESVLASIRQPTDFLGMPMLTKMPLTKETQHLSPNGDEYLPITRYAPPSFAIEAAVAKRSLLLLDEVNTSPPAVQAALLRLLFEGVCGELELPEGVRMFLAMNETEDAAGGWEISLPLGNRVGWLSWNGPSYDSWVEYMVNGSGCKVGGELRQEHEVHVNPVEQERLVDEAWVAAWPTAVAQIAGFLKCKPGSQHKKPDAATQAVTRSWPSLRTWDFATCALAGCSVFDLSDEEATISVDSYVGAAVGGEFRHWARNLDLPAPEDVIFGTVKFEHKATRLDRTAAVLAGCTAWVCNHDADTKAGKDAADRLWAIIGELPDNALDLALPQARSLQRNGFVVGLKRSYKVLARLEPLMKVVGM